MGRLAQNVTLFAIKWGRVLADELTVSNATARYQVEADVRRLQKSMLFAFVITAPVVFGAGSAYAYENPDQAPSPVDLNVNIPLEMKANGVGTPLGQLDLPEFEGTVTSEPASEAVRQVARDIDSLGNASSGESEATRAAEGATDEGLIPVDLKVGERNPAGTTLNITSLGGLNRG